MLYFTGAPAFSALLFNGIIDFGCHEGFSVSLVKTTEDFIEFKPQHLDADNQTFHAHDEQVAQNQHDGAANRTKRMGQGS